MEVVENSALLSQVAETSTFFEACVDLGLPGSSLFQKQAIMPIRTEEQVKMRVMVIVKATKNSEAGIMPSEKLLADMGKYNEELVKAGIMLAGEGIHPSSKGKRIVFSGGKKSIVDGPFAETKELLAGFWLWQVRNMDEALEWARRCPDPMPGEEAQLELRPVFEAADFGAEFTPELREQEDRLREQIANQTRSR
jgi:hypothetical protein